MVGQFGLDTVRVSWMPPPNPPSEGYRILISNTRPTDFSAGITATSTASSHLVQQSTHTVTYWLIALYETPIVVGPVSATIRGEEMYIYTYTTYMQSQ